MRDKKKEYMSGSALLADFGYTGEILQKLIQIPSEYEREHTILSFVEKEIRRIGFTPERVSYDTELLASLPTACLPFSKVPDRHCLVVKCRGSGGGRSLVLNSHLDIVPAGDESNWANPPFSGNVDVETRSIYGRGAMDDKAGVSLALSMLDWIANECPGLSGDLIFHFVIEDEITGNGSLLCLEAGHVADAALILDGTRGEKAISQHAGNLQFSLYAEGRPASVSVSHLGVNACEALATFTNRIRDEVFSWNERRPEPWSCYPSPNQFVTQSFHSEGAVLTVPSQANATCYLTFTPDKTLPEVRSRIEEMVLEFQKELQLVALDVTWEGHFFAEAVVSQTQHLFKVLKEESLQAGMGDVELSPSTGTSDMRHFIANGIPCLLYGPGRGFNPHRFNEYYELDSIPPFQEFLRRFIRTWCA
jgi:acetylornithine deacetylase